MKLTEREKWLMQQAWNASKYYEHELNIIDDWLNEDTGLNGANTEMLLAHDAPKTEPIVKKVNADNLPDKPVFCVINGDGYVTELFNKYNNGEYVCVYAKRANFEITHYIEQEDLIKMFEDSK